MRAIAGQRPTDGTVAANPANSPESIRRRSSWINLLRMAPRPVGSIALDLRPASLGAVRPANGPAPNGLRSMMQATDHGLHSDATKPFDWLADRRIFG